MNEKLLAKFNEIEKKHWWWEGRRSLIKILLKGRRPKKILDVGCGTGETLSYLQTLFPKSKLFGIDTSLMAVSYSRSRGHKNVFKADAGRLPFKSNSFDVVLFLDVLEHIKDDQKAILEAKRVLTNNGLIIITAPGLNFIWSDHDIKQGHQRRYTRRGIKELAKVGKLKISFISYFNFFLSMPIIAIRLLSKIKAFKKLANYDRSVNYDIAHITTANLILKYIFIAEIACLKFVKYPIGISIVAKFEK
jgi:ubiquinone/menaquinone biosynthesis C-methylase UbiE